MNSELDLYDKLMEERFIQAAASKINQKLSELREAGNERICRRWIWELIQNANDCANPSVDINITCKDNILCFSHNGKPFDYESLMNIITQISTKETIEGEDNTGKFGTGFITTHLLSEKVMIKGVYIDENLNKNQLAFEINRSGKNIFEIKDEVKESLEKLKRLRENPVPVESCLSMEYETNFIYNLSNANQKAINDGKNDLDKSIIFVLAFVETINKITYNDISYYKCKIINKLSDNLKMVEVIKDEHGIKHTKKVLVCFNNDIEIAAIISEKGDNIYIEKFDSLIPRIFCKFPLVGTEEFCLPFVVNSRKFSVEEPRDGIYESSNVNRNLLLESLKLYKYMLMYFTQKQFKNIHNICFFNDGKRSNLQIELIKDIKNICNHMKIVDTNRGDLSSLLDNNEKCNLIIPDCSNKEYGLSFWDLLNSINIKFELPSKENCIDWAKILGTNFRFGNLCKIVEKRGSLSKIKQWFNSEEEMFTWLNKFYNIAFNIEDGVYIKEYSILLNQNEKFEKKIEELYIDDNIDEDLIEILFNFGIDVKETLISKRIKLPEGKNKIIIKKKSNREISNKISEKVRKILVEETQKIIERDDSTQKIFNKIMLWFMKNPQMASELFLDIYDTKHRLCSNDELIEKFQFAEETEETLKKFNIDSIDELNQRLEGSYNVDEQYSKFSQDDLLIGLAIDNLDELEKNNNMESVKYLLKYKSGATYDALKKVQELVERSKRNVINYLNTLPMYEVKNRQELSKTVYGDIYKHGQKIKIIVRPSDSDMIIVFYQSELDVLDDNNYEIWIDNGKDVPRQLTFGDILITTGIRVIPLKNLFDNV